MSIPGSGSPLLFSADAAGPAGGYQIERSLRFNADDQPFLERSGFSGGDNKKWTLSFWFKNTLQSSSVRKQIFCVETTGRVLSVVNVRSTDGALEVFHYNGTFLDFQVLSAPLFRDPSAWYHFVIAYDTTISSPASDRVKMFANGIQITNFQVATYPSLNFVAQWNTNSLPHRIGENDTRYLGGYLAEMHFLNSIAPSTTTRVVNGVTETILTDFGEFDATTGVWNPTEYTGSYGSTGFYLDFADNSSAAALGYDAAGSNDWTVNNILASSTGTANAELVCCQSTTTNTATAINSGNSLTANGTVTAGSYTINSNSTGANDLDGSSYLKITASSAYAPSGAGQPWTAEAFVYFDSFSGYPCVLQWNNSGGNQYFVPIQTDGSTFFCNASGTGGDFSLNVAHSFSTGQWYHMAAVCDGTRVSTYVDGTRIGTTSYSGSLAAISGYDTYIGAFGFNGGVQDYVNGRISNVRWTLAAVYDPSATSITVPTVSLSTSVSGAILGPASGIDSLRDSPTNGDTADDTGLGGELAGNYCTLNPLDKVGASTISNGNLEYSGITGNGFIGSTFGISSGKWYFEWTYNASLAAAGETIGLTDKNATNASGYPADDTNALSVFTGTTSGNAQFRKSTTVTDLGFKYDNGDIVGIAIDLDNYKIWVAKNGVWYNSGNPAAGSNQTATVNSGVTYRFYAVTYYAGICNFGQRAFANTSAPSGFKCLCTANLDDPTIEDPSTVMDVVTYTGNGSTQTISGLGFSPDFVWIKNRNTAAWHQLFDAVRGAGKALFSNATNAEITNDTYGYLDGFTSTGFSLDDASGGNVNASSTPYVAWTWDAGTSTASNTSGTITSQVRANISAGFSIVSYSAGASGSTVGHGLGVAPQLIIAKSRTVAQDWVAYHSALGSSKYILLSSTVAAGSLTNYWGTVGSSTFGVSNNGFLNNKGDMIAYCWTPVEGYSAFGSYTGNGSSDGPFVYTGFKVGWLLIKNATTNGEVWNLYDSRRDEYNVATHRLLPNDSGAESTTLSPRYKDLLSNGFKIRGTSGEQNTSGDTYIYAAFAENPFKYARAR